MKYTAKHFDPADAGATVDPQNGTYAFRFMDGDARRTYVFSPEIVLALNVALATERPLLVSGEPGSGKTTLARSAAAALGWWYYQEVVTSRTQATHLEATFDTLQRLNDAYAEQATLPPRSRYLDPGALWWAFDPEDATHRGDRLHIGGEDCARNPGRPGRIPNALLLLDEIDKADPDVPNDLLEPFDVKEFTVRETNHQVGCKRRVLLILTTNGERELPPAFIRRCVQLNLKAPDHEQLVRIANERFGEERELLHRDIAAELVRLRGVAARRNLRQPSTAEYLDAIKACVDLGVESRQGTEWRAIAAATLWKHEKEQLPEEGAAA